MNAEYACDTGGSAAEIDHDRRTAATNPVDNEMGEGGGLADPHPAGAEDAEAQPAQADLTEADFAAAEALLDISHEGIVAWRRLINRYGGSIGNATMEIVQHARSYPLNRQKSAEEIRWEAYRRAGGDYLGCGLALISLSGQSAADSKAALMLMNLSRDRRGVVLREQREEFPLASVAQQQRLEAEKELEQRKQENERDLAMRKFQEQYPQMLNTTSRLWGEITFR